MNWIKELKGVHGRGCSVYILVWEQQLGTGDGDPLWHCSEVLFRMFLGIVNNAPGRVSVT